MLSVQALMGRWAVEAVEPDQHDTVGVSDDEFENEPPAVEGAVELESEPPPVDSAVELESEPGSLAERPTVTALRVEEGPIVDGYLRDEVWQRAQPGGPLIQNEPDEGAEPSESTEFRILYDEDALYIGVWCYDSEPDEILAREMAYDRSLFSDDYLIVVLDTFLDRRNGYEFVVNPNGARYDALITANRYLNSSWDTIWVAQASIDEEGWKVEIEIPFKSISFDPKAPAWGFNIARRIKRRGENSRWSGARRRFDTHNVSEAGLLRGLEGIQQGVGLDLIPYVLGRYQRDRVVGDEDSEVTAGGDLRYHVTPNLTASLSYNTDFAETEVDARQINLTRFPLFFPEKREFFLQDAGIFSFGGLGSSLIPFFSRRVGLSSSGEQVPIVVAGKLTGRINSFNLGFIDALVDQHDGLGQSNAFVGRVSKNIFDNSSAGVIFTAGDPNSTNGNLLGGADFSYFTTEFLGDELLETNLFLLGTYTDGQDGSDSLSFGGEFELPNDEYDVDLEFRQIDENFHPALGFVTRRGIRFYSGDFSYRPRPESVEFVRQAFFTYENYHVTDLSNRLESAEHEFRPFFVRFESFDEVFFNYSRVFDAPDEDFEISDGVLIPADDYWWDTFRAGFETASKRPYELEFVYQFGEFYSGDRNRYSTELTLRLIRYVLLGFGYSLNQIRLPAGDFDTRLGSFRAQINFTPDLIWYNLLQYDSVSDTVGYNGRLHWQFRPGANIYLVLNLNVDRADSRWALLQSEATAKVGVTFRF